MSRSSSIIETMVSNRAPQLVAGIVVGYDGVFGEATYL